LLKKPEGKRPLGKLRRSWVDNIMMDLWGEGVHRVLVVKPEGKRPLGKPRRWWVVKIRMDLWGEGGV
jgi:hypothetical protein